MNCSRRAAYKRETTMSPLPMFHSRRYSDLVHAVWQYRGFICGSIRREFKSRYIRSALGLAWALIEPLSMILVYTLVFSAVMRARLPGNDDRWSYSIYLCAGILTWGLFSETLLKCQTIFLDNANLLKKVSFPRVTLPVIVVVSCIVNFLITFSLLLAFLALVGRWPGWGLMYLIPMLFIQQGFALGLGIITGTLNVFFRDIGKTTGVVLTFWFWFTPIVYPASIIPAAPRALLSSLNPMAPLVTGYQQLLLDGTVPAWPSLSYTALASALSLAFGYYIFARWSDDMVDEL